MKKKILALAVVVPFCRPGHGEYQAYADPSLPPASSYQPAAGSEPALVPAPQTAVDDPAVARAHFSGKRLAVEIVGGELVSLLVSYGVFSAACGSGTDCLGAGLLSYGADFAITPLAIWAGGRLMGGQGSLGWTYAGAGAALTAWSVPGTPDETPAQTLQRINVEMTVSALLMPVASAFLFEASSQKWFVSHHTRPSVTPLGGRGAAAGVTIAF